MDFAFLRCFVDNEADRTLTFFRFLMPYIMMASKTLSSQDVSVKRDLLQKAMFVRHFMTSHFMTSHGLSIVFLFYVLGLFIEKLKASFPEHAEVPELPQISKTGPRLTRMLLPVCKELEKLMFPPCPELGSYCSFGRCKFCDRGEHFYSDSADEGMNVEMQYTCRDCQE